MPNPQNIIPPKKGERRNPKGRPKKLVSSVIDALKAEGFEEVTASHVKQVYTLLISLPAERLKQIASENDMPMLYRIIAKEVLGKKGFEVIERMLDRAHGKAKQAHEVEHSGEVKMPTWLIGDGGKP